jgi:hypothetical protein
MIAIVRFPAPLLDERQAEHLAVEALGRVDVVRRERDEVDAGDERLGCGGHGFLREAVIAVARKPDGPRGPMTARQRP